MTSLAEVQEIIKKQGLSWEAGTTPIGSFFESGNYKALGFIPKAKEPKGGKGSLSKQTFAFSEVDLPRATDWRSVGSDGDNYVTGVREQGDCGSCVAFATCAVLESRRKIAVADPYAYNNSHLSVCQLFFCGAGNACDDGWVVGEALDYCRKKGVGKDRDHRYEKKNRKCKELPPEVKVKLWRKQLNSRDRKIAIAKRGPVIAGMHVFRDLGWYKGGVYRPTTSESVGLHAVSVIGYDDDKGYWLIKNSWGTAWGEGGFARIGYGTCGIDTEYPFYDVEVEICEPEP